VSICHHSFLDVWVRESGGYAWYRNHLAIVAPLDWDTTNGYEPGQNGSYTPHTHSTELRVAVKVTMDAVWSKMPCATVATTQQHCKVMWQQHCNIIMADILILMADILIIMVRLTQLQIGQRDGRLQQVCKF
jgi:hypothetical protein